MAWLKYLDGTTDITRTVHFGKPSAHEKACYTAVRTFCFSFRTLCYSVVELSLISVSWSQLCFDML